MTAAPRFPRPTTAKCPRCQANGVYRDHEGDLTCLYCGELWPRFVPPASVVPFPKRQAGRKPKLAV